jgi:hypothetical protein
MCPGDTLHRGTCNQFKVLRDSPCAPYAQVSTHGGGRSPGFYSFG